MWLTHDVYIEAPVADVFAFWLDPANSVALAPDGQVELLDLKTTEDGVGTSYRMGMKVLGRTIRGPSMVYTRVIPNELIVDQSSNGMHGTGRYEFTPEGNGTRLTFRGQPQGLWRLPLIVWLVGLVMGPRHEQMLTKLKETLEAPYPSGAGHEARSGEDRGSEQTT
jgi:uncharacterized protein YndB with AHSA1/START domain